MVTLPVEVPEHVPSGEVVATPSYPHAVACLLAPRNFAGLEKRVVLVGQGNKFEIWDEDTWNRSRDEWLADENMDDLSPELSSLCF